MTRPPDPEMRSPAVWESSRAKSQKSSQQQQTYTIPVNVQAFIALLPFSFPFVCVLASCGGSR
jgi:hypothetical protein